VSLKCHSFVEFAFNEMKLMKGCCCRCGIRDRQSDRACARC
jgi:hypothetical protein